MTAPSSPASGGNGVYVYGGGFPTNTYRSANYWVDVVVDTAGVDTTPPSVTGTTPAGGATGVPPGSGVTANFSEVVEPSTVQLTVTGPGGAVAGTTRVADDRRSVVFASDTPLNPNTVYTASVRAEDTAGNVMASPHGWAFTTGPAGTCPCSLSRATDAPANSAVDSPVELGVRWRPDTDGWVTAIKFYKTVGDTGSHTGTLWSSTGTQLATGTFTGESASGWQTLELSTPVAVTAGTTYVVSYHTSAGRYGYTTQWFTTDRVNGPLTGLAGGAVYRYGPGGVFPTGSGGATNYWVDVVFRTVL